MHRYISYAVLALLVIGAVTFSVYYDNFDVQSFDKTGQFRVATKTTETQPSVLLTTTEKKLTTKTYFYGSDLIASKDGSVVYYHNDYLGSTRVQTSVNANKAYAGRTTPFGSDIYESGNAIGDDNSYKFTGQEQDNSLYYYGARYYDTHTGRFIQLDPVIDTQSAYRYADNNPMKFIDKNGMENTLFSYGGQDNLLVKRDLASIQMDRLIKPVERRAQITFGVTICVVGVTCALTYGAAIPFWGAVGIGAGEGAAISIGTQLIDTGRIESSSEVIGMAVSGGALAAAGSVASTFVRQARFMRNLKVLEQSEIERVPTQVSGIGTIPTFDFGESWVGAVDDITKTKFRIFYNTRNIGEGAERYVERTVDHIDFQPVGSDTWSTYGSTKYYGELKKTIDRLTSVQKGPPSISDFGKLREIGKIAKPVD